MWNSFGYNKRHPEQYHNQNSCWVWKTTNTTFTTNNNLHATRATILLQGKQQNTTLRLERASLLSWRNCSISWYPFSSWHNLNKLSSDHDLPRSVVTCCKGCSSYFPMCPRRANIHHISKHSATFFGPLNDPNPQIHSEIGDYNPQIIYKIGDYNPQIHSKFGELEK